MLSPFACPTAWDTGAAELSPLCVLCVSVVNRFTTEAQRAQRRDLTGRSFDNESQKRNNFLLPYESECCRMPTWEEKLSERLDPQLAAEIDKFETEITLRKQGKLDEKVFAETRLRRGCYGQRYDNGHRHDGIRSQ